MMTEEVRGRLIEKMRRELGENIAAFLSEDGVTEIMLNDDGHVWVSRFGEGTSDTGIIMTPERSLSFLGTVASFYGKTIHHTNTILAEALPIDGSRLNGVIPPTTEQPTFNIRKKAGRIYTLEEYVKDGRMTEADREAIRKGVGDRLNFLIAGGTGSGKTTLANGVIREIFDINPGHRIISMEDTPELQIPQHNKVRMYTDEHTSMQKLLFSAMRQSPDRIIIGEVRNSAALDLLKSWNTGQPGGVTTIHANSCSETLERLEMLILEAVPNPMQQLIGQAVGLVLFIEKLKDGPVLTEIMGVNGWDRRKEAYDTYWLKRKTD